MDWSDGRIHAFIANLLRSGSSRWPPRQQAIVAARVGKRKNPKTGRLCEYHKCAICKGEFLLKEVHTDHIEPVVDTKEGFTTWDNFIKRHFVETHEYQILCIPCHKAKTKLENQERKKK